jgi:hypothetical protein
VSGRGPPPRGGASLEERSVGQLDLELQAPGGGLAGGVVAGRPERNPEGEDLGLGHEHGLLPFERDGEERLVASEEIDRRLRPAVVLGRQQQVDVSGDHPPAGQQDLGPLPVRIEPGTHPRTSTPVRCSASRIASR